MSQTTATQPKASIRNAKTPQELLNAVLGLEVIPVMASDEGQPIEARAIFGRDQQMLMADTAQGTKGRYVVSTTAVVDVPAFQKALAGFEDKVVAGAYPTTDLARQAFYDLSDKYTVRAIIWEDTPNLGDIVAYGKIKGLLRKTEYQNRAGEEKQSWELYQVTSALVTKERKAVKLGSYRDSANIIDNAAKTETPQGATPSGAPKPPPTSGAPTPKPKTPVMKMIDGEAYSVEALLAGKWLQADIDALPNA